MRLTLFLDHACDLRCTYCYNGEKFKRAMTEELGRAAVDMVLADGRPLKQCGFFGGEPLLRFPMLQRLTRYVRQRTAAYEEPVTLVVTSNMTQMTPDKAEWLAGEEFWIGVSLDGCQEAQDACRVLPGGGGSYDQVVAGIRAAQAAGLRLKSISVVDPKNVRWLDQSFDHLLDLGFRSMSLNINYEAEWDEAAREELVAALDRMTDRFIDAYRRNLSLRVNLLDGKIITHLKGGFACSDRCDFGCEELAVSPSGKLYPCDRLIGEDDNDDVVIGTVADGVDISRRDALITAKNKVLEECGDCALLGRCMHWCGCVNYAMTGDVGGVSGLLCWIERKLAEAADRAAGTLFAEKNPAFLRRFYASVLNGN